MWSKPVLFSTRKMQGEVPVLEWLNQLLKEDPKGYVNCVARIKLLAATGYELRRPAADYLRDSIYEHLHNLAQGETLEHIKQESLWQLSQSEVG
jgi:hypothetical protein